ncbi:MAG: AAA family ATPase, partial [DPANN group archaeon]|nr:AAA family ATPase [DPANN group archaeon]
GVPNKEGRLDVLKIHTRNMPIVPPINKGYVESKISSLSNKKKELETNTKTPTTDYKKDSSSQEISQIKEDMTLLRELNDSLTGDEKEDEKIFKEFSPKDREKLEEVFMDGLMNEMSAITHGFVGADLEGLCKEAAMAALRRVLPQFQDKLKESERIPKEILEKLLVLKNDFKDALKMVRPSAMREVLIETPKVKWADIGGLETVKQETKEAIEWPLKSPEVFKRMGIRPPKGILFYGPPGCGKTLVAKAVASECQANFICIKGPEVISKWVGESEKAIREVFKKARQVAPCIVFFDEIDSIASKRGGASDNKLTERVVDQLLTEMDGLEEMSDVLILAATNRPELLDAALLRPGRFDRFLLIPPPDEKTRHEILKIHTKSMPIDKTVNLAELAKKTEGYSGADIEAICRESAMLALREDLKAKVVTKEHFDKALEKTRPSLTKRDIEKYVSNMDAAKRGETAYVPAYMG